MQFACPKKNVIIHRKHLHQPCTLQTESAHFCWEAKQLLRCYYIRSSSPNLPPQTAGGYPDSRGKKSLRDRSRIKKLAQVSAKFLKSLWLWTQISLETALLQFFYHCTQVRLDESERQRSAASVVRANLDVVARYPSHFVPGWMLKHFVALLETWFTLSTPSIKTLLFIIRTCLIIATHSAPSSPLP